MVGAPHRSGPRPQPDDQESQSASMAEERQLRQFDLEADRRNRRFFVALLVGFAILAVAGGIFAAWLILMNSPEPPGIPPVTRGPSKAPEPIEPIRPIVDDDDDRGVVVERKKTPSLKQKPTDQDINRGLAKLQKFFNQCAREHGGLEGTKVRVDFSVGADGRPTQSFARNPYARTPLGRCVANVIKTKGRFTRSRDGLADIRREIILHPGPSG